MRSEVQNAAKRMPALVGVLKRMPPRPTPGSPHRCYTHAQRNCGWGTQKASSFWGTSLGLERKVHFARISLARFELF